MSSMSASDAAPLPRLGEVYFDVRGESRSMRLSWYADTGVAVFSIWQGGTCTGTFRLPMADLPRMVEALQRGPHGDTREADDPHDDPRATELHGMPGRHGMPGQQGRAGHDAGHASGQYDAGDHGSVNYGRTERYDVPGRDLEPEPDTGYSDPGFPAATASNPEGHGRTAAHGRYEETRAVYPDESIPGALGGYRAEHGGGYEEPQTGVYRGDLASPGTGGRRPDRLGGHQDDPLPAGYRADPHDEPLHGGYGNDPLSPGHRADPHDGPLHSSYEDDSLPGGYREESRGGPYRADSLPGTYRADLRGGHHDDPLPASYGDEPRGRRADRHASDYLDDPLTGAYPDERRAGGYPEDPHGGYAHEPVTARYRAEPPTGDYPTGPSDSSIDEPDYLAPAGNAGYSPARPYVAPPPGDLRRTGEGRGGRRRRTGGEESDLSPDSFPYGRPSAEPEVRGRRT